jgi:DNA-binding IscR family transcriptional regulator
MLDLPRTTVRGLSLLKALARHDEPAKAADLARETGMTAGRAAGLLRLLARAGLADARPRQGWALARPSDQITVLEVVEALGASQPRPAHCHADWTTCDNRGGCALAPLCRHAHAVLLEIFRSRTLADLQVELPALF